MIKIKQKIKGWVNKTKQDINFQKCPNCGKLGTWLTVINETDVICPKCDINYPFRENSVNLTKNALECFCGELVPLIDSNLNGLGEYICPVCLNLLAIEYNNDIFMPKEIFNLKWIKKELNEAKKVNDKLYVIDCINEKSLLAFKIIHNRLVMPEGHSFTTFKPSTQKGMLFFDKYNMEYVGCIVWSEDEEKEKNILRQIFVFKDKRKQGYGTLMMKYWIEYYGLNQYSFFGVESPNGKTLKILVNLGHAKEENGTIKEIDWELIYNG